MEPITDIVIHLSGPEVQKISTTRFIRIKDADGKSTVDRINVAINVLAKIQNEYAHEADKSK